MNLARAVAGLNAKAVPGETQMNIDQRHRWVAEAEINLAEAKRKTRAQAKAAYEEAVAAEMAALIEAGFDSYDSYVWALNTEAMPTDDEFRRVAELELAEARQALDEAREVPDVPTRLELEEREAQMRLRAAELLGRVPGADPAAELRALCIERDGRPQALANIAELLQSQGIPVEHDVVATARGVLGSPAPAAVEALAPPPAPDPAEAVLVEESGPLPIPPNVVDPERSREFADLEEQRAALDRKLADLEAELKSIDEANRSAPARFVGTDLIRALESALASYEARDLLAGRLPLVLDGVLDGLDADTREAAVEVFARAREVQTVVVTNDPEVMQTLSRAGATLVRWPQVGSTAQNGADLHASPSSGA